MTKKKRIANDTLSTRGYIALMRRIIENAGVSMAYIFTNWRMWVYLFDVVESCGLGVRNMIVWDKGSMGMGYGVRAQHEIIMMVHNMRSPFENKKAIGNVISCKRTKNEHHMTEKPVELLETIIGINGFAKTVIDLCLGSGSTILACERAGKNCYGMELTPYYCDMAVARWEKYTGNKAKRI